MNNEHKLKVGDTVIALENLFGIVKDKEYKIERIFPERGFPDILYLEGSLAGWFSTRFKPKETKINMRNESVIIKVENEEIAKVVWNFLLNKGYAEYAPFTFNKQFTEYIWVNVYAGLNKIALASNDNAPSKFKFNASSEFGELVKFFTEKPKPLAPPEKLELNDWIVIYQSGVIGFNRPLSLLYSELNEIVAKRDAFMKQWTDYHEILKQSS